MVESNEDNHKSQSWIEHLRFNEIEKIGYKVVRDEEFRELEIWAVNNNNKIMVLSYVSFW